MTVLFEISCPMHSVPLVKTAKPGYTYKCLLKACSYGLTPASNAVDFYPELNQDIEVGAI